LNQELEAEVKLTVLYPNSTIYYLAQDTSYEQRTLKFHHNSPQRNLIALSDDEYLINYRGQPALPPQCSFGILEFLAVKHE